MLTQERYQTFLNILYYRSAVTVAELSQLLDTSESTIRRDLTALDEMGKLKKVFGGATSLKQTAGVIEDNINKRKNVMHGEKDTIASYAAKLVHDNDFVYIDAGTTTSHFIAHLTNKKATYVTNGIVQAKKLLEKGFNAYMIGGRIKPLTEAVVGADGIKNISNYNFTKAFMGTNGIDKEAGFTTPDVEEALIKGKAIEKSYITFVLADHTKFRKVYPVSFAKIDKCCIITDILSDDSYAEYTVIKEVLK